MKRTKAGAPVRKKHRARNQSRRAGCDTGKVRYRDKSEATAALQRIGLADKRDKTPGRAYQCDRCHGWHLTSARERGAIDVA